MSEHTDEELLLLVRQGRADAYSELWRRYVKAARTAAGHYRRLADADDLVAEAYAVILRALRGGNGPTEQFRPYLYATIRNLALREMRRAQHIADDTIDELADRLPDESLPEEDEVADRRLAMTALEQLPERWRKVLWHSEVEGRTTAEIGQLMGLKPAAVAVLAFRARAALREAWLSAHLSTRGVAPGCRTAWARLAPYSMGTLPEKTRDRVTAHLSGCADCARGERELRKYASKVSVVLIGGGGAIAIGVGAEPSTAVAAVEAPNPVVALRPRALRVAVIGGVAVAAATILIVQSLVVASPNTFLADSRSPISNARDAPSATSLEKSVPGPSPTATSPPGSPILDSLSIDAVPALIAASSLTISGTGTPGATVIMDAPTRVLTTVDSDGRWQALVSGLTDGDHTLSIRQRHPQFQDSVATAVQVGVDTQVPLPPLVSSSWSSTQLVPPDFHGTADPSARVDITRADGSVVASTTADATGAWSIASPAGLSALASELRAQQVDPAGNASSASVVGPFSFVPAIVTPAAGSTASADAVSITMAGWPGQQVRLAINGANVGIYTMSGDGSYTVPLTSPSGGPVPPGNYLLSLRYWSATEGESSTAAEVAFSVE